MLLFHSLYTKLNGPLAVISTSIKGYFPYGCALRCVASDSQR